MLKKVFCIGIGGIGVSGLAELLHQQGIFVSGSDTTETAITKRLASLGIPVFYSHDADNIGDSTLIIYSSAVPETNPERKAAFERNIPQMTRGQLLANMMKDFCGIAVAGTHGKTTTSGLISWVFEQSNQDPSFMVGGILRDRDTTMRSGKSRYFIAESDESDASFLLLSPTVAVITNIDADHMETYGHNFEKLKQSFLQFVSRIPADGFVVLCIDDPVVRELKPHIAARVITYGVSDDADYQLTQFEQTGLQSTFTVKTKQNEAQEYTLNLGGKHNALNAISAIIVAHEYHLPQALVKTALTTFPGMRRRFHPRGEMAVKGGNALVFDDYGHHPTELRVTLQSAKSAWPDRRVVMVFQPHRYSRTRDLMPDFVAVLNSADQLVLMEVYAASEQKIPGADGLALFAAVKKAGAVNAEFVSQLSDLPSVLQRLLKPNDVVILQGAGNIVTMADKLIQTA
ncbi:MAG: UDP-N-acetylmuramate--L-alanine ligase [Gammaproteobacteria bacterium]|nr:UDP-N-acetylmuramate--L-alanine ligase [Gammaproteobacteria bacterium]